MANNVGARKYCRKQWRKMSRMWKSSTAEDYSMRAMLYKHVVHQVIRAGGHSLVCVTYIHAYTYLCEVRTRHSLSVSDYVFVECDIT